MHCLPQRLKSTLFEIFSNGGCLEGTRSVEKISNNVDFILWGNGATTWEYFLTFSSETKIMKITHSVEELLYTLLEVFISLGRWNNRILPRFDIWIELKPCQTMTRGHCGHNFRFLSSAMQRKMSPWPGSTQLPLLYYNSHNKKHAKQELSFYNVIF